MKSQQQATKVLC
ncbi:Protein of unknown function [Bacillus cereus]|nr:Protein of unknown function [Bacillus cereus]SCN34073.1 Protein of unknown function [Bacillus cereus]